MPFHWTKQKMPTSTSSAKYLTNEFWETIYEYHQSHFSQYSSHREKGDAHRVKITMSKLQCTQGINNLRFCFIICLSPSIQSLLYEAATLFPQWDLKKRGQTQFYLLQPRSILVVLIVGYTRTFFSKNASVWNNRDEDISKLAHQTETATTNKRNKCQQHHQHQQTDIVLVRVSERYFLV